MQLIRLWTLIILTRLSQIQIQFHLKNHHLLINRTVINMKIKNEKLIAIALFCIFIFTGSASAAVDFPEDEAGISAYVKATSSIDLNDAKSVFATIERETSNYIIGTVALDQHTEEQYPHVYVSTDGWIVAYYPNDRPSSWLLPWADYAGGPISSTTLSEALGIVASAVGGTTTGLKYYDFRYPDASKMMIIIESEKGGTNFFEVTIPTNFLTYAVDWSHYNIIHSTYDHNPKSSYGYLNDVQFSAIGSTGAHYGSFTGQFENGIEQTIKILAQAYSTGRIGLVLEYAE